MQFDTEADIEPAEAERLLLTPPKSTTANGHHTSGSDNTANIDTMVHDADASITDLLLSQPLDRSALRAIEPAAVLVARWPPPLRTRFYRNLLPELQITICPECWQAFHAEDFELQLLQRGRCPFCRTAADSLLNGY